MQERHNSSALAMDSRLSCVNPLRSWNHSLKQNSSRVHFNTLVKMPFLQYRNSHYDDTTSYVNTVDSRYLAPVGSQNSRARVKWFSRYLALSREGHDSRIQDHRPTLPGVYNSLTVCWAIIEVLTFPGSLHTSTSHQRQNHNKQH